MFASHPAAKTARRIRMKPALIVAALHPQGRVAQPVAAPTKVAMTRRIALLVFARAMCARFQRVRITSRTAPKRARTAAALAPKVAPQARLARGLAIASLATARRIPLARTPRAPLPPAQTVFKTALKRPLTAAVEIALVAV